MICTAVLSLVAPGYVALHSDSLSGQKETPMTVLTTDPMTVQLTDEHYTRILERCRPAMAGPYCGHSY